MNTTHVNKILTWQHRNNMQLTTGVVIGTLYWYMLYNNSMFEQLIGELRKVLYKNYDKQ